MRVIPVIDLMNGCVVRGIAGRRSEYRPIESRIALDSKARSIASAFVERFGFDTVYVADLDAIVHGRFQMQLWKEIADAGVRLWLDAGVENASKAHSVLEAIDQAAIAADFILGLESIESEDELQGVSQLFAPRRAIFSLDMQNGQPLARNDAWKNLSPLEIVTIANTTGMHDVIVLDLADVGASRGTRTLDLCRKIRRTTDNQTIIAGGGVRGIADLQALADAGCDAVLVASALHDGRLTPDDIRRIENLPS